MRSRFALLLAATAILSTAGVGSAMTSDKAELSRIVPDESHLSGDAQTSGAGHRFLRRHETDGDEEKNEFDENEDRANMLDDIVMKLIKTDAKKVSNVATKKEIEMVDMRKFEDAVNAKNLKPAIDAKIADDLTKKIDDIVGLQKRSAKEFGDGAWLNDFAETLRYAFSQWKRKGYTFAQAQAEIKATGVKDEAAIKQIWAMYQKII